MKKIHLYFLGFILIIIFSNLRNINLLLFGKLTKGTVIRIDETYTKGRYGGTYYHSVVRYNYNDYQIDFWGQSNLVLDVGSNVKVIYLPNGDLSKVYSFTGMFADSTFMSILFIVIWSGFFYVYKRKGYWD